MTDPLRWTDDGAEASAVERDMLSAGQGMGLSPVQKQQAWAGILVQTAAVAAATGTNAATVVETSAAAGQSMSPGGTQVASWGLSTKIIGISALLGALGGGYWATFNGDRASVQNSSETSNSLPPVRQKPMVDRVNSAKSPAAKGAAEEDSLDREEHVPAPEYSMKRASNALAASPQKLAVAQEKQLTEQQRRASRLREESIAVLEIRRALRSGNPSRALSLLEQARNDFPDGVLGQEREALTIEALVGSGARAQAAKRAQSFLKNYPKSPFAADVTQFATP